MFQSYEYLVYLGYLGYDDMTKQDRYKIQIIDTDLGRVEVVVALPVGVGLGLGLVLVLASAIIDCYSKRNLPVAPNLFRGMLQVEDKYPYWTIDLQVEYNKQYNPRWKEVEQDMQMYLMLS